MDEDISAAGAASRQDRAHFDRDPDRIHTAILYLTSELSSFAAHLQKRLEGFLMHGEPLTRMFETSTAPGGAPRGRGAGAARAGAGAAAKDAGPVPGPSKAPEEAPSPRKRARKAKARPGAAAAQEGSETEGEEKDEDYHPESGEPDRPMKRKRGHRNPTAYNVFVKERMNELLSQGVKGSANELFKMAVVGWKALPDEKKAMYRERAKAEAPQRRNAPNAAEEGPGKWEGAAEAAEGSGRKKRKRGAAEADGEEGGEGEGAAAAAAAGAVARGPARRGGRRPKDPPPGIGVSPSASGPSRGADLSDAEPGQEPRRNSPPAATTAAAANPVAQHQARQARTKASVRAAAAAAAAVAAVVAEERDEEDGRAGGPVPGLASEEGRDSPDLGRDVRQARQEPGSSTSGESEEEEEEAEAGERARTGSPILPDKGLTLEEESEEGEEEREEEEAGRAGEGGSEVAAGGSDSLAHSEHGREEREGVEVERQGVGVSLQHGFLEEERGMGGQEMAAGSPGGREEEGRGEARPGSNQERDQLQGGSEIDPSTAAPEVSGRSKEERRRLKTERRRKREEKKKRRKEKEKEGKEKEKRKGIRSDA